MRLAWRRAGERIQDARRRTGLEPTRDRVLTIITIVVAGFMIATSAMASRDGDLRPNRNTEMVELVKTQAAYNEKKTDALEELRSEVNVLAREMAGDLIPDRDDTETSIAMAALSGPGVRVTLTDAPLSVQPAGVADDLLVVHQQDIQAVTNALWESGAEAIAVQGQRLNSTTGIKCVGNTVVLEGVPYAPPYVIEAIGDPDLMMRALEESPQLKNYRDYVEVYRLGYEAVRVDRVAVAPYRGSTDLKYAQPGG